MWRKAEGGKPGSGSSSSSESSTQYPGTAASPDSSSAPEMVSRGIKIKGEISGHGDFLVDGELEGKVCISDGTLTIGPNGRVKAQIEARQIIVRGEVVGSLKAHERIQIMSTAKVTGDMDARGIAIEDGAELHSKVATPRTAPSEPATREVPSPEVAESKRGEQAWPQRPESSQRAKGAAAGSPSEPDPQKG